MSSAESEPQGTDGPDELHIAPRFDWRGRYVEDHTPWDLGGDHPELRAWLDGEGADWPRGRVLVPGCGRGHDALALARAGFQVDAVDIVDLAGANLVEELERLGGSFHVTNVLALAPGKDGLEGPWELVFEHTIFCAIEPDQRPDFGRAMARCVAPGGYLMSFLFPIDKPLEEGGPPHRATPDDLVAALGPDFELVLDEPAPRARATRNWSERRVLLRRKGRPS